MVKKYTTFDSQLDESVVLTDKAKLSLYKKSQNSGISVDILEEVYRRGYRCWSDIFGGTQDSFAFDRVNSFIAGGFAAQLDEDLRNWFNSKHPEGGWKRINSKGEVIGPCAREPGEPKPKCMSNEKRAQLTKKERAAAVASKRRHDPVADRSGKGGKPVNVSNVGKGKISEEYSPLLISLEEKNAPTNPALWSKAKSLARSKFDVYPSAYANGWAAKWYKSKGGGWKSVSEDSDPCWDDYKMVGMKKGKRGKPVPNCVLKEKDVELDKPVLNPGQLAKKHGKTIKSIKQALEIGTKVEGEHTTDKDEARKIASAHIGERPDYYKKLNKAGLEEGKIKDAAKVAALMGALTAHAGKVYDVGNVAAHNDDPVLAAATIASYANPASRALQMLPTALKVDKANKGEDELARQKKYPKKKVEEGKLTQEPHSKNKMKSASRFDASDELVSIYKHDTPGQNMKEETIKIIRRVIRECLEEGDVIRTKFAVKNLQKRGIEGPHKIGADDFERAWVINKMPKSSEPDRYIAYHGDTARIMSDPSKGKHADIKRGAEHQLIIDPDGSKTGERGIYAKDKIKTAIVRKQAPKKKGNVVPMKETIEEATYKGKTVPLNKPMKGDVKKSKVFVDPDGDGKAQKVNFGDKTLSIKKHIPARKKSYCARSGGQGNLTDKTSANYWSRRAWNCEETEVNELSVPAGTTGKRTNVSTPMVSVRMASGKIEKHPPGKSGSSGGGGDEE